LEAKFEASAKEPEPELTALEGGETEAGGAQRGGGSGRDGRQEQEERDALVRTFVDERGYVSGAEHRLAQAGWQATHAQLQASHGQHCHSTLPLTTIGCHSLGIYPVILLSLLSFSAKMTVSPRATAGSGHAAAARDRGAGRQPDARGGPGPLGAFMRPQRSLGQIFCRWRLCADVQGA
jgi:hypothetical protein